ncbi:GPH family glycoside/pentoside/hexuronide:cation symporter [Neobacillus niacini]|uniref:MFS transporter n=1 Tax=Neobacillus driksii TaxID=3035913 RepID=UPI00278279EB|nr:glycoside-pentoside-hexuronide (GPH):cation symporter [Neobacillus niacini]MDQ0972219.1 GPH family glycoside/pentoside/hexuronide:cation symporter [Neobacillus niacini]
MDIQTVSHTLSVGKNNVKLSKIEKFSYGFGDFASNLMWGSIGSFLLYFYTDVAFLPVAVTGTIMLVSRILDAFIDPVIGAFIDRTNSKWGRTKPYILFGIIPLCVFYILSFTTIDGSDTVKIIYAYITYIIAGLLYSVVNIPYGALITIMTRDSNEKTQLSSIRVGGTAIGQILVTAGTMPLVGFFGRGNQQLGFFWTAILFSVLGTIAFMIILKNCKERYIETKSADIGKRSLRYTYKSAFRNGPWVSALIFTLFMFIRIGAVVAITIYFCLQVLKNPAMISILLPMIYVGLILAAVMTPAIIKRFGHRNGNIIGLSVSILCLAILPYFQGSAVIFAIFYLIAYTFGGICGSSAIGMTADSVDYNEWKFGIRAEGTLYAGNSFATKVGMAIGGALIGYALMLSGYDPKHVTASAITSIQFLYYFVPILCSIIQILAVSFYKLDKIHPQIVSELNMRQ